MTSLETHHYFSLTIALPFLAFVLVAWRAFDALKGPLAHLPGPQISKWTNLKLKYKVLKGDRVRYIHSLHQQYGPIVRISPQEACIADITAAKTIYKVGGPFLKTDFYDAFTGREKARNLFTETDFKKHGQHRRLTASNFSEKWVAHMEPFIAKNVQLAISRMSDDVRENGWVDIFKWFMFMATDVIGESSFGESFRMLESGKKNQYMIDLEGVASRGTIRAELPWFVKIMQYVPVGPGKEIQRALARTRGYADESINRYWKQFRADPDNVKPTLLTKLYAEADNGGISAAQLQRDAAGNIVAGTDTTAITATNAVWLLSHHPGIQQELIREVSTLPTDFNDEDLRSLKLLQNVITETLRIRGAVTQSLPRTVPPDGAEFCGHFVPGGSIVGIQSYTMHRDPAVWKEPESFDPSRWNDPSKDMLHSYYPFGGGSRVCIGMHFAQLELRHALANFYRTFEFGVKPSALDGFSEAEMEPVNNFLEPPAGKRCLMESRK